MVSKYLPYCVTNTPTSPVAASVKIYTFQFFLNLQTCYISVSTPHQRIIRTPSSALSLSPLPTLTLIILDKLNFLQHLSLLVLKILILPLSIPQPPSS